MSCQFELTVICDNYAKEGLLSEHGLSFALRTDGNTILFDTGNGETLIHNATKLGIDLADISHLVLSHGHYDHTGGIGQLLHYNKHCPIIEHPFVLSERYSLTLQSQYDVLACQRVYSRNYNNSYQRS